MRMKKIMILAVAAIALVACSRTFEKHETEGKAIGFGTWSEVMTKTVTPDDQRVQGSNTFREGDSFAVYGYKSASDDTGKSTVFDDDVVVATAESGDPVAATAWDYNNHRFWDSHYDKYVFFGVSPSSFGTSGNVNAQTGAISTEVTFSGKDSDVLIANKTTVNKTDGSGNFNNHATVNLVFNHAASLVDVIVKKDPALADATVKVTKFELRKIQSKGTLSVSAYDGTTTKPTIALANWDWDDSTTATYDTDDCVRTVDLDVAAGTDTNFPGSTTSDIPATSAVKVIDNLVVMPQAFDTDKDADSQQIVFDYTLTVTDGASNTSTNTYTDNTLYLCDFDYIDNETQAATYVPSWEPGKHYIFYITIDANAITFSGTINGWDPTTVNGYNYLVN